MRLDTSDLKAAVAAMGAKFPQGMRRALKKTEVAVRTEMSRLVAAETGLPVRRVKDEIKSSNDDVSVTLKVRGHRVPLIDFKARGPEPSRGKGRGVSYTLQGERRRLSRAFIATMPSGHRGVFERTGQFGRVPKNGKRTGRSLERISEKYGPSIAVVFDKFAEQGAAKGSEALKKNVQSQIDLLTKR